LLEEKKQQRFLNEARLMRQFYPEVSEISAQSSILPGCDAKTKSYEASNLITKLYFLMPIVVGCALDECNLANHSLIFVTATINAVIKGLKILHDENVGHGDVKAHNIIFNQKTMIASYIDLGFAGRINESGECEYDMKDRVIENMSYSAGTILYAAPETMSYFDEITGENILKSDIYSLGALILWLLCLGDENFHPVSDIKKLRQLLNEGRRYDFELANRKLSHPIIKPMIDFLRTMTTTQPDNRPKINQVFVMFSEWSKQLIKLLAAEIIERLTNELNNNRSFGEADKAVLNEVITKLHADISSYKELSDVLLLPQNLAETSQIPNIIERIYQQCLNKLKMNPTDCQKSDPEINLTYSRK